MPSINCIFHRIDSISPSPAQAPRALQIQLPHMVHVCHNMCMYIYIYIYGAIVYTHGPLGMICTRNQSPYTPPPSPQQHCCLHRRQQPPADLSAYCMTGSISRGSVHLSNTTGQSFNTGAVCIQVRRLSVHACTLLSSCYRPLNPIKPLVRPGQPNSTLLNQTPPAQPYSTRSTLLYPLNPTPPAQRYSTRSIPLHPFYPLYPLHPLNPNPPA